MEVDIAGTRGNEYVCDSNEVLEFKLVRSEEDLKDDSVSFKPEMTHQIFGDSESIFGYKDLSVKLYYSACRLSMYLSVSFSSMVDPKKFDGVEADDVFKMLITKLAIPDVITNRSEFVKKLKDEESFLPYDYYGEKLTSFAVEQDHGDLNYEIFHCDTSYEKFLNFHERLQTFILFYIDAASYIDVDDAKWQFFVVYEKFKNNAGATCFAVAGYCTVYEYWAYARTENRMRPRVSQMLVLPPFQRRGLGAQLLCAVYSYYRGNDHVLDITVEDPNPEFQQVRDYVDTCLCAKLDAFRPDKLREGFSDAMAAQACKQYKINKKQARRVYEILRLKETNVHDDKDYASYRLDVKKRLNTPFQKQTALMKKLKPLLDRNPQMTSALGLKTQDQRFEHLEQMFSEAVKQYDAVLRRVDEHPLSTDIF